MTLEMHKYWKQEFENLTLKKSSFVATVFEVFITHYQGQRNT